MSTQMALREYLKSSQRAIREKESNQREREQLDFVIPSEPKILCLVCLDFFFGFLFEYLRWDRFSPGWKCIVSGWPKNAEKLTKAFPFTDSITSLNLLPDLQHLLNSTKVEKRKASSVKCLLKLSMISLQVSLLPSSNSTPNSISAPSPLQVNSTPPRVELKLCL